MTNEQLAQLLFGVAKANIALLNSVSGSNTVAQSGIPAMKGVAQIDHQAAPTLDTIYARMVLHTFSLPGPDLAYYAAELTRLTK